MSNATPTPHTAFAESVKSLRALGAVLGSAADARFEPSPAGSVRSDDLVPNPTLDVVLDPRRSSLSDEVRKATQTLDRAARDIRNHTEALTLALERWAGHDTREIA